MFASIHCFCVRAFYTALKRMSVIESLKLIKWLVLLYVNFTTYIPRTLCKIILSRGQITNKEPLNNTIFIGGAFTFPPNRMSFDPCWGMSNGKVCWMPKIGPVSSPEDGACELFASLFGMKEVRYFHRNTTGANKAEKVFGNAWLRDVQDKLMCYLTGHEVNKICEPPKISDREKINIVTHSNGFVWVSQFLIYLHYHKMGMIKLKKSKGISLTEDEIALLMKVTDLDNDEYKVLFYNDHGDPMDIGPSIINKMAFISPVAGGIEYIRSAMGITDDMSFKRLSLGWFVSLLAIVYNKLSAFKLDNNYKNKPQECSYIPEEGGIHVGWVEPLSKKRTDLFISIAKLHGIPTIRVVSESSTKIFDVYLGNPFNSMLLLIPKLFGCGWYLDNKHGDEYSKELSRHDGVISTSSQIYGNECTCHHLVSHPDEVRTCNDCGSIFAKLDHFGIISKTKTALKVHDKIFDWLSS